MFYLNINIINFYNRIEMDAFYKNCHFYSKEYDFVLIYYLFNKIFSFHFYYYEKYSQKQILN